MAWNLSDEDFASLRSRPDPNQNTGLLGDLGTDIKRGALQLPGAVAGLADIPIAAATGATPFTSATDWVGEQTGFQPGRWAEEAADEYSPARQEARQEIDSAWDEGGALNIASAYARNPSSVLGLAAESLPMTLAGGALGLGARALTAARTAIPTAASARGASAMGASVAAPNSASLVQGAAATGRTLAQRQAIRYRMSAPVAAGVGEGAVAAGIGMSGMLEEGTDPQRAALAATGMGVGTGILGTLGGRLAQRMGVIDPETLITGGMASMPTTAAGAATGLRQGAGRLARRMFGGAVSEGVFEELPQSVQETMWENWAAGRPLTENVPRAAVEGMLAGGVMGAGFNIMGPRNVRAAQGEPAPAPSEPDDTAAGTGPEADAGTGVDGIEPSDLDDLRASLAQQRSTRELLDERQRLRSALETATEAPQQRMIANRINEVEEQLRASVADVPTETPEAPAADAAQEAEAPRPRTEVETIGDRLRETGRYNKRAGADYMAPADRRSAEAHLARSLPELEKQRPGVIRDAVLALRHEQLEAQIAAGIAPNSVVVSRLLKRDGTLKAPAKAQFNQYVTAPIAEVEAAAAAAKTNPIPGMVLAARRGELTVGGQTDAVQEPVPAAAVAPVAEGVEQPTGEQLAAPAAPAAAPAPEAAQSRPEGGQVAPPAEPAGTDTDTDSAADKTLKAATIMLEGEDNKRPRKPAMERAQLNALVRDMEGRIDFDVQDDADTGEDVAAAPKKPKKGRASDRNVTAADLAAAGKEEGTTALFRVFHLAARERDKLLMDLSASREERREGESVAAAERRVRRDVARAQILNELMVLTIEEIESRAGMNNLQAAQFKSKHRNAAGQSSMAALFSMFYADLRAGLVYASAPVATLPNARKVRERRELGSFTDSRLWSIYTDGFTFSKTFSVPEGGARALMGYLRMRSGNVMTRRIASGLYHMLTTKDAATGKKTSVPDAPKVLFYTDEGRITGLNKKGTAIIDKADTTSHRLGFFDPATNTITIGPDGHNPQILLHEMLHAVVAGYIAREREKSGKEQSAEVRAMEELRVEMVAYLSKQKNLSAEVQLVLGEISKSNDVGLQEFLAYGLTHEGLRAQMERVKRGTPPKSAMAEVKKGFSNALQKFADVLRALLGLRPSETTAFSDFLDTAASLLQTANYQPAPASVGRLQAADLSAARDGITRFTRGAQTRDNLADRITRGAFEAVGLTPARLKRASELVQKKTYEAIRTIFPAFDGSLFIDFWASGQGFEQRVGESRAATVRPQATARALENVLREGGRTAVENEAAIGEWLEAETSAQRAAALAKLPEGKRQVVLEFKEMLDRILNEARRIGASSVANLTYLEALQWAKSSADVKVGKGFSADIRGIKRVLESQRVALQKNRVSGTGEFYYMLLDNETQDPAGAVAVADAANLSEGTVDTSRRYRRQGEQFGKINFVRAATLEEVRREAKNVKLTEHMANTLLLLGQQVYHARFAQELVADNDALPEDAKYIWAPEAFQEWWRRTYPDYAPALIEWGDDIPKNKDAMRKARNPAYWVKVPNTPRWGELAGQVVNGGTWASMLDLHDTDPILNSVVWNRTMQYWKSTKTVLSPAVHFTNAVTNITMMYMHDIPAESVNVATRLMWAQLRHEAFGKPIPVEYRAALNAFMDSGAMLGEFRGNEIQRNIMDRLAKDLPDAPNSMGGLTQLMGRLEGNKKAILADAADKATWLGKKAEQGFDVAAAMYAFEDNMFRMAAFLNHLENKRLATGSDAFTDADYLAAGNFAKNAFVNYDINAKWVQAARRTLLPFLAWPYRMLPMVARIAAEKPWKIANILTGIYVLNALAWAGSDEGEEEEYRKNMPEYMQSRIFGIGPYAFTAIPFTGAEDTKAFFNIGKYVPHGDMLGQEMFGQSWWPSMLVPGGPLMSMLYSTIGYDPFTQRSLHKETNSQAENLGESMKYLAGQFTPGFDYQKLSEWAIKGGKMGPTGSEPPNGYLLLRQFGPKVYEININDAQYGKAVQRMVTNREYRQELARIIRAEQRYPVADWAGAEERRIQLMDRLREEMDDL